jgi:glutathione S-transferase
MIEPSELAAWAPLAIRGKRFMERLVDVADLGRANSINVQKVLWCCGELGLEYERIDADNEFGIIEDGNVQLWESNVIVRYLSHKHGAGSLCPADIGTRFDAERWMDWQATVFWPALRPLFIELIKDAAGKARRGCHLKG